jgi:HK97 family phage portal protein
MSDPNQLTPMRPEIAQKVVQMPSLYKRLTQAVSYALRGGWFSPEAPIAAQQPQTAGRRYDYPAGYNLVIRPQRESGITFEALRKMAKQYDLLRLVIETRKDQICGFDWSIVASDQKDKVVLTEDAQKICDEIKAFFEHPADSLDWHAWLRTLLEDCFVVDAITLYPIFVGKKLQALEIIDPSTIKIVIDESGRIANPPYPAYQQVLKGTPTSEYRKDQLLYFIRNPQSNAVYGYSHVEQILMTVRIGLSRELTQLNYFTEGNIPEAIAGVPENWTGDQIQQFQTFWDGVMKGSYEKRFGNMRFVPGDASKINMLRKDEATLKGEFDEWLARIVCYTFSVSPIPFIKQTNRSVAENMESVAKEEGLLPLLHFIRRIINTIIKDKMGIAGYEFRWNLREDVDPKTQADIDMEEIEHGIVSIDDVRRRKGLDPLGVPPMIWTNSGPVPVEMFVNGTAPSMQPPAPPQEFDEEGNPLPNVPHGTKPGAAEDKKKPGDAKADKEEARKRIAAPFRQSALTKAPPFARNQRSGGYRQPR